MRVRADVALHCKIQAGAQWSKGRTTVERRGLKSPTEKPKNGRLWLSDGSWVCLKTNCRNHGYMILSNHRTDDGCTFRTLTISSEFGQ